MKSLPERKCKETNNSLVSDFLQFLNSKYIYSCTYLNSRETTLKLFDNRIQAKKEIIKQ